MFLYSVNYPEYESELYKLDMKYTFEEVPEEKTFLTGKWIDPDRSPFIKYCVEVFDEAESFEELLRKVSEKAYSMGAFRVKFVGDSNGIEFNRRHELEGEIAFSIKGRVDLHEPENILAISRFKGKWIFGRYMKNRGLWRIHEYKPCNYSNSLNTRIARVLINLGIENDFETKLIDPCCGVGTVVMEGLSMGVNIKGYDINPKVVERARKNLKFFEYPDVIETYNLHELDEVCDSVIVDLPYGISTKAGGEERRAIIRSASRIANKMVIVSIEDIDEYLNGLDFNIVDRCTVSKMRFVRQIFVCKRNS